jgi:hypothetical protein
MILITGDSWACGEWDGQGDHRSNISHGGLAHYLRQHGHTVINLGKGGGSNLESASRVTDFLAEENGFADQVDCAIVFQTEWHRDAVNPWNLGEFALVDYDYTLFRDRLIARFYYNLSATAQQAQTKIYLVGGCSDTVWMDQFEQVYPGVQVACQSWVNLMINNNHRIDQPCFSRFGPETEPLIAYAKSKMNSDNIHALLEDLTLAESRNSQWSQLADQDLLCVDRTHPNRQAHKILFDFLIERITL